MMSVMRFAVAGLILLGGCNQVFGLRETVAVDAQQFDGPPDAPYQCPAIGTLPQFAPRLEQAIVKNCFSYTTSRDTNRAAAFCVDLDAIADGPIDEVPVLSTLVPAGAFDQPRLTPEGDEMWVRNRGTAATFEVYRYTSEHEWTFQRNLAVPSNSRDDLVTAPTRAHAGVRRFIRLAFDELTLYEYDDDGTTATMLRTYTGPNLGVSFFLNPNLSADGLRLVFVGSAPNDAVAQTYYADRANLDVAFGPAQVLTTAAVTFDPFLTEDCSRLYTNGLGSVFYAVQR